MRRPSRCKTARTRRSGPVGALENKGSTLAAKSESVRIRQNVRSASTNRFNDPAPSMTNEGTYSPNTILSRMTSGLSV